MTGSRRVHYGVASSLDGYISGPKGEADWINMDPEIEFSGMWAKFDTLLIGRKTFAGMVKPGKPAKKAKSQFDMKTIVFSRTLKPKDYPGVTIVADNAREVVSALKASPGKDIWLFGGGELFRSLATMGLVDTVSVAIMPVMLGGGLPLFPASSSRVPLKLTSQQTYKTTGIVSVEYEVRKSA